VLIGTEEVGEDWKTLRWYIKVKSFEIVFKSSFYSCKNSSCLRRNSFFSCGKIKVFGILFSDNYKKREGCNGSLCYQEFFLSEELVSSHKKGFTSGLTKTSIGFKANGSNLISSIMIASM